MLNETIAVRTEDRFSRIFQYLPHAVLVARADDSVILDINEAFTTLTGYGPDAIIGRPAMSLVFFLDPDLWTRVRQEIHATGEVRGLETGLLRKDGRIAFVRMFMRRVELEGISCHLTTIHDISARGIPAKEAQCRPDASSPALESLLLPDADIDREEVGRLIDFQALQDLMNSFYKTTRIPMAITDVKGNVQVATGWQDICTQFHRIHPETLANCKESDTCLSRNLNQGEYALYKCKNGMWDLATPITIGGRHIANLFLGQFLYDDEVPDYDLFRKQAERYGFNVEEYLAALDRVPRWSRDAIVHAMEFYTKMAVMISRLSIGNIRMSRSLMEQKRVEDELRESEEMFRVLAETATAAIALHQGDKFLYVNPATSRIFGYSETELREMNFWEWAHVDCRDLIRDRGKARQRGEAVPNQYEHRFTAKGGREGWVLISAGTLKYRGKPTCIITLLDITEAKRAEEKMQAALAEKTVLLKEVHHRVKNNLQIISSLLYLQSEYIQDEQSRVFFRDSQNRIGTMALVHQKLYQSESLAFIDFREYIEELANHLYAGTVKDRALICLTVDAEEVLLGVDEAIPCGLIVNELVSNSLKHAFPDGGEGEISVRCRVEEDGWITLTVSDNGIGLPPGLDFRNTETLGLQLVTMLVKQLRGRIAIDPEPGGTAVRLSFPGYHSA
jgi:PAS domain S-box-containing protein